MSRCQSISLCCVVELFKFMSFFPYTGKVFTLTSDLSLIYVEDTILIDFSFTFSEVASGHLRAFF